MSRLTGVDISVFTVGGANLLADLRGAQIVAQTRMADSTPAVYAGRVRTPVKQSVAIRGAVLASRLVGGRVCHLDVQSLSMAGISVRPHVLELEFEGLVDLEEASGLGDPWSWPVVVHKDYRARLRLAVDTASPSEVPSIAFASLAGKAASLALMIDGQPVELDMVMSRFDHRAGVGSLQTWDIELVGSALPGAPYPAAPMGTSSLLAHAFNAPGTAVAISALRYAGNFVVKKFGFRTNHQGLIESSYEFASQGVVSVV